MKLNDCIVFQALLLFAQILACICMPPPLMQSAAAAASPSVQVLRINPVTGDDSQCGSSLNGVSCKTIARAVGLDFSSVLVLEAGVYSEPTVHIRNVASLTITGVSNAVVFDCRRATSAGRLDLKKKRV